MKNTLKRNLKQKYRIKSVEQNDMEI